MHNNQLTILLADDDPDDKELLKDAILLIEPSAQVRMFENGLELKDYLDRTDTFSRCLILLDFNMPLAGGLDVLKCLAQKLRLKHIPAIVWSTSNSIQYREECLNTGARKYLIKPNEVEGFNELASDILAL